MSLSYDCFIIAEIGSNWNTLNDCLTAIAAARVVGADAVKFQFFTGQKLYGPDAPTLSRELPEEWLPKLKEKSDACDIEFMCTLFDPEDVKKYDHLLTRHKVASSDLTYRALLEAIRDTGKEVLLSVGASNFGDIRLALGYLNPELVTLMYCVSSYPSYDHNLFEIDSLADNLDLPVGFSDHSRDIYTPLSAYRHFGCRVIEKHFNPLDLENTPDAPHSVSLNEFHEMVKRVRYQGDFEFSPKPSEKDMFLRHNRRLIALRDIEEGDTMKYGYNYGCFRSSSDDLKGQSGLMDQHIEGKSAPQAYRRGQGIS